VEGTEPPRARREKIGQNADRELLGIRAVDPIVAFSREVYAALLTLGLHGVLLVFGATSKEPRPHAIHYEESRVLLPPLMPEDPYTLAPTSDNVLGGKEPAARCAREMTLVKVQHGQTLATIARNNGLDGARTLWTPTLNPELIALRADPALVAAGDIVRLPPRAGERYCDEQLAASHELAFF